MLRAQVMRQAGCRAMFMQGGCSARDQSWVSGQTLSNMGSIAALATAVQRLVATPLIKGLLTLFEVFLV